MVLLMVFNFLSVLLGIALFPFGFLLPVDDLGLR